MATVVGVGSPLMKIRVFSDVSPPPFLRQTPSFIRLHYHHHHHHHHHRSFTVSASSSNSGLNVDIAKKGDGQVRVRFAPSPTGGLHVGGARTALYNYLFTKSKGGKFILRVEDTDLERNTKESEANMMKDLSWLGLHWDEGPDAGGDYGPYRQSERNVLYKELTEKLMKSGHVYRCFCSNEELAQMKEFAKKNDEAPIYTGKWATATEDEVNNELEKGTPYTYRFRVPKDGRVTINDLIRGEVGWELKTLGDFVIMRSNGQPVYNFCVSVDDATMGISHVIRAEEHLNNTLRQALIYKALGYPMPYFAHVSLILAPDRSKLSKRHGAISVGQFREMGYLPQAMVNYLALLGWGDGTENEFFTIQELVEKFSIDRVNKSGAIFDLAKLRWMNGQYLRALPSEEFIKLLGERWVTVGILTESEGMFVKEASELLKDKIDVLLDSDEVLTDFLSYPVYATLASPEGKPVLTDNLSEVATNLLAAYDNGELVAALEEGPAGWQKWVKNFGKSMKRKGKSLFMPLRVLLTGKLHGPDMGSSILLLHQAGKLGIVAPQVGFLTLDERLKMLREADWEALNKNEPLLESASVAST